VASCLGSLNNGTATQPLPDGLNRREVGVAEIHRGVKCEVVFSPGSPRPSDLDSSLTIKESGEVPLLGLHKGVQVDGGVLGPDFPDMLTNPVTREPSSRVESLAAQVTDVL